MDTKQTTLSCLKSVMRLLLDHQADFTIKDEDGHTALSLARRAGKISAAA